MSMLVALIVTELVTAAVGGLMTFRILSGLEERLISKLADDYGHEPTSDIPFSHSLDFAQYKVLWSIIAGINWVNSRGEMGRVSFQPPRVSTDIALEWRYTKRSELISAPFQF